MIDDELQWSSVGGWGVPVTMASLDDHLLLQVRAGPRQGDSAKYSFTWKYRPRTVWLHAFSDAAEIGFHRQSTGSYSLQLKAPWWWLFLIFSILPTLRLRVAMKALGIRFGIAARCGVVLMLILMIGLNAFLPSSTNRASPGWWWPPYFEDLYLSLHGFPFVICASDQLDDGSHLNQWNAGGIVSNAIVAIVFSFLTAVIIQTVIFIGRRIRARLRAKPGHCPGCGYNLFGNVSGICPECGKQMAASVAASSNATL